MITLDALVTKVKELAERYPDAIYPQVISQDGIAEPCKYTAGTCGGGTGCIFGQALVALGGQEMAIKLSGYDIKNEEIGVSIDHLLLMLGVVDSQQYNVSCRDLLNECVEVQQKQDTLVRWADAVKEFK